MGAMRLQGVFGGPIEIRGGGGVPLGPGGVSLWGLRGVWEGGSFEGSLGFGGCSLGCRGSPWGTELPWDFGEGGGLHRVRGASPNPPSCPPPALPMAEQIQKKLQGELEKYQQLQKGTTWPPQMPPCTPITPPAPPDPTPHPITPPFLSLQHPPPPSHPSPPHGVPQDPYSGGGASTRGSLGDSPPPFFFCVPPPPPPQT